MDGSFQIHDIPSQKVNGGIPADPQRRHLKGLERRLLGEPGGWGKVRREILYAACCLESD